MTLERMYVSAECALMEKAVDFVRCSVEYVLNSEVGCTLQSKVEHRCLCCVIRALVRM